MNTFLTEKKTFILFYDVLSQQTVLLVTLFVVVFTDPKTDNFHLVCSQSGGVKVEIFCLLFSFFFSAPLLLFF